MKAKKFLAIILSAAMFFGSASSIVFAEEIVEEETTNVETVAETVLSGSGTEEDPYLIDDIDDLVFFRDSVNAGETTYNAEGVYVALAADIDMASVDWNVNIGDDCNATFDGIFDGRNHTISNLSSTETEQKSDGYICTGLFGAIYGSAEIKNLNIENATINTGEFTGNNVGVVAGFVYEGTASIENVNVSGDIKIDAPEAYGVGTIVGYAYYGTPSIENCSVLANEDSYINAVSGAGGIIGYGGTIDVLNSSVENLSISAKGLIGGVAGLLLKGGAVNGCSVKDVELTATKDEWVNSVAVAVGTIASNEGITISDVDFSNVIGNGTTVTNLIGSTYAEQPTEVVPAIVAKVDDTYYTSLTEAIKAAAPTGTVELLRDVTVDEWVMIAESLTIGGDTLITLEINGLTIDGNGHTLAINDIESSGNGGYLFYDASNLTVKDLTIKYAEGLVGGIGLKAGTIENVTFDGGVYGILPKTGNVTITGCTFKTNGTAIYFETERDGLVVTGNTFEVQKEDGYAIILRGNTTFNDNIVLAGRVNAAASATGTISGNDFGDNRFKVYNEATATIENNKINVLDFNNESEVKSTFEGNTFSADAEEVLKNAGVSPAIPDVIEIYDWEDLKELDKLVEDGNQLEGVTVKLMNDIDLYEMGTEGEPVSFNPIGANKAYFKGTFDGQGHTIKNMYQSGWELGYDWDNYGTIGLFAYLWNATVKNLTIENAECLVEGGNVAAIAGCAWGDCTFENITVKNSTFATYNNRAAGIVGYTGGGGTMTFKDIYVDEDTVIAALWGSYDCTLGGVVGSTKSPTKFVFENVHVFCKLDCYNDVTASYKWYSYRMCGLLIGRMETLQENSTDVDPRGIVTIKDVYITIGEWAKQTYIFDDSLSKGCQRVEPGYAYDGVNVENYPDAEVITLEFNTIIGGPQSQSAGYYGSDITKLRALEGFDTSTLVVNFGIPAWDGVTITNLDELKKFRDAVNNGDTYKGKTVTLTADIDLANENWTPIGSPENPFLGTFDGGNHTISNLVIEGGSNNNQGFFGVTKEGEIKNLTINNAKVSGRLNVGVFAGTPYTSKYTNIKLTGHVEVNGMAYVGGVGGKNAYANWTDITVDVDSTSYVKAVSTENGSAYRTYVGGVIGFMGEGSHKVSNVTSNINVYGDVCDIGGITGIAHYGNTFENCTATGKVECANSEEAEVGGIAGVWHNQKKYTVTFTNCKYQGTSDVSAIGAPYSPSENTAETSGTLLIDGVQVWPVAGVAKIGDVTYPTLQDALKAATEGCTITILDDITVSEAWDCRSTGAKVTVPVTIDGNGKTLKLTGEIKDNNWNTVFRFEADATVKNLTIDVSEATGVQRGITSKLSINAENVKIIGNNLRYGIIFGEGAGAAISDVAATIANCEFTNCQAAVSDNANGQDAKSVTITGSTFNNASAVVSASESITFTGNNVTGEEVNLTSYTAADTVTVTATGNTLSVTSAVATVNPENVTADAEFVTSVAKIGSKYYLTFEKAISKAKENDVVTLVSDIILDAPVTMKKSITIDGNGHSIKQSADCNNNIALVYFEGAEDNVLNATVKNTTFDGLKVGAAIRTLYVNMTVDNCVFQNCEHTTVGQGLVRLTCGTGIITNSKFQDNICPMGITFNWDTAGLATDTLTVDNCEFTGNTANKTALIYYVKGAGCEIKNSEFKNNKVNCSGNGATIYLGFQEDCTVTGNFFENNTVTEATDSTRVAGAIFFGYEANISGNAFVNNKASNVNDDALGQHICTSTYYDCVIDLSDNYFDGQKPNEGKAYFVQHKTGDGEFALNSYYTEYTFDENGNVVLSGKVVTGPCSITPGYTSQSSVWGEGKSAATESYVVKLYVDETVIATASLNDVDNIIDGTYKNLTWSIPFAVTTDPYWTVEWVDGYPSKDAQPTKVELWVDGEKKAENVVKMSGPDDLNKVVWEELEIFNIKVAKIGETEYATLEAAIDAAKDGDIVTLLNDITITNTVVNDKKITLDLAGFTLAGKPQEAKAYAVIENLGELTVTGGGEIICDHQLAGSTGYAVNTIHNRGALVIENATIENKSTATNQIGYAIDNNSTTSDATVTVNGGIVKVSGSNYYDGIRLFCNSQTAENNVTVTGGEVSSIWLQNPSDGASDRNTKDVKGSINITGGKVNALYLEPSTGFSAIVTDGEFGTVGAFENAEGRDLTGFISGGTFKTKPEDMYAAEGFEFVLNDDSTFGVRPVLPTATVTDAQGVVTNYTTLAKAVEAATIGETVTLLSDVVLEDTLHIESGKNVTIDLAGKTISQTKAQTAGYQMILNDGNLTINDTVGGGKISYTDSGNGGEYISDTIYNCATLVINGGTIENLSSSTVANNGYPHAVDTYSGIRDTSVIVNGGTIYCAEYSAMRMFCVSETNKADLVINDGTVKGAIDMQNGISKAAHGTLTINGGTFETTKNANNIRFANWNGVNSGYGITASITDGNFNGGFTTQYVPANSGFDTKIVTGGTFTIRPDDKFAAEGFEFVENADGTFGVQEIVEKELINFTSSNTSLGNALSLFFFVLESDITDVGSYAVVTHTYADSRGEVVTKIPYSDWKKVTYNGKRQIRFEYGGIAAKEMADNINAVIYNSNDEVISESRDTSIKDYIERALVAYKNHPTLRTALADMANYGTEAQIEFEYNESNLANSGLTEEQKSWATTSVEYDGSYTTGNNFKTITLSLKDNILLNFYFLGLNSDSYAEISYTNHKGEPVSYKVDSSKITYHSTAYGWIIPVDTLAVADYETPVTCTVYNADGSVHGTATCSMATYCMKANNNITNSIVKFASSTHAYLHP